MWIFLFLTIRFIKLKNRLRIGFPIRVSIYGCSILHRSIFIILFSHKKMQKNNKQKKENKMTNSVIAENTNTTEKFQNAEQLWFWFLYCKSMQNNFRGHHSSAKRPCEVLDVEVLITKLYLSGKLSEAQLEVMKKFGDKRHAPRQYVFSENKSAHLWETAMKTLGEHTLQKGWTIE